MSRQEIQEKCKRRKKKQEEKLVNKTQVANSEFSNDDTLEAENKNERSNALSTASSDKKHLPKKEQYKKQVIVDKTGVYDFQQDPEAYKKARKRQ